MGTILDIFHNDAFSMVTLTDRVNRQPYAPFRIGSMGLFENQGVATSSVAVAIKNGQLALIPNSPRGGPGNENAHLKSVIKDFRIPHLELNETVNADEIQNVRAFGTENQLVAVQDVIDERIAEMRPKHAATLEYGRIGALRGIILDADGSTVIYNLYNEFGFTQTQKDFTLGTTTANIVGFATEAKGLIEDALGAAIYDHVHALAGKTFFENFVSHPNVKAAYQYFEENGQKGNPNRDDLRYQGFTFGGITWEQYRGKVGGVGFIPDNEATIFPVGVPGLFKTYYAPADYTEAVNTMGLPIYVKTGPDASGADKGRRIWTQSNPLSLCLRPDVLIKGVSNS